MSPSLTNVPSGTTSRIAVPPRERTSHFSSTFDALSIEPRTGTAKSYGPFQTVVVTSSGPSTVERRPKTNRLPTVATTPTTPSSNSTSELPRRSCRRIFSVARMSDVNVCTRCCLARPRAGAHRRGGSQHNSQLAPPPQAGGIVARQSQVGTVSRDCNRSPRPCHSVLLDFGGQSR